MKRSVKIISVISAIGICSLMLAGCADKSAGQTDTAAAPVSEAAVTSAAVTQAADPYAVDPAVKFDISAGVTDKMYGRAMLNEGNVSRLAAAMKKARDTGEVTVGVIGGSITQGSLASDYNNCYASKFFLWWQDKFPECKINTVNAGIGGTDSYLGVHRADSQLLSHEPDAVIVEFSVNDTDRLINKYSYDSLVRKILSYKTMPAVILLFTTQENGTSLQDVHMEIGECYDLPMISYREAVYPEVEAGTLAWKDISPDNIHPNDAGHDIISQLLGRYLDGIYDRLDSISEDPSPFDSGSLTGDFYKNGALMNASDITAVSSENFEVGQNKLYGQFPDNWITQGGGALTFEIECGNLGILILRTTDGKSGVYEVYVDGERKGRLDADFSGGWGSHAFPRQVLFLGETAKHTVEIRPEEGSEDKGLTILALMVS